MRWRALAVSVGALFAGCTGGVPELVLSLRAASRGDDASVALWVRADDSRIERYEFDVPSGHDLSAEAFRIEIENSRLLRQAVVLHAVTLSADGVPRTTVSLSVTFPIGGILDVTLLPIAEGCDRDGDGFLDCAQASCCVGVGASVRPTVTDCLDDPSGDRQSTPPEGGPAGVVRASDVYPFFDVALERSRSYWCNNGISNSCGPAVECDYPDLDGDGFPAGEPGPDGAAVGPNHDCNDFHRGRHPGAVEVCNAADDDCDGQVDEQADGRVVGGACSGVKGSCAEVQGLLECDDTGGLRCSVSPGGSADASAVERCNGWDEDCDGVVDEIWSSALGQQCGGAVECSGVVVCAAGGNATCCSSDPGCDPGGASGGEVCDRRDNDCDGATDESFGIGVRCGLGACHGGVIECHGPRAVVCSTEAGGSNEQVRAEQCDGVDSDCNGAADDGLLTEGQPCEDPGRTGECRHGVRVCLGAGGFRCLQTVFYAPEECDGLDSDCDGLVDEEFPLGQACAVGVGSCQRAGEQVCTEDGAGVVCGAVPGAPPEPDGETLCDDLDNDCDGAVDEELGLGQGCAVGVGLCRRAGSLVCEVDGTVGCSAVAADPPEPGIERSCDGVDNDCYGAVDEDLGLGRGCAPGAGLCRRVGVQQCDDGGGVECSVSAAVAPEPGDEVSCDAADNDCDGAVDEGLGVGDACFAGIGPCREQGRRVCDDDGGLACTASPGEAPEPGDEVSCDGVDNDCDREVDEGLGVGDECFEGQGQCRQQGAIECDGNGGVRCDAAVGESSEEVCDGVDNDCDGGVDEPGPALLTACTPRDNAEATGCEDDACVYACLLGWRDASGDLQEADGDGCARSLWRGVAAGRAHTCGLRAGGEVACWGDDSAGQLQAPETTLSGLSSGRDFTCGIAADGTVECWGQDIGVPPVGAFDVVAAGSDHACGLRPDGTVACWGSNAAGQGTVPDGSYVALAVGFESTCGVRDADDLVVCWGRADEGQQALVAAELVTLAGGDRHYCGLAADGSPSCWGLDASEQATPTPGSYTVITTGTSHTCALAGVAITCWGLADDDRSTAPARTFTSLAAGFDHTCAVVAGGGMACWGVDTDGQATPLP